MTCSAARASGLMDAAKRTCPGAVCAPRALRQAAPSPALCPWWTGCAPCAMGLAASGMACPWAEDAWARGPGRRALGGGWGGGGYGTGCLISWDFSVHCTAAPGGGGGLCLKGLSGGGGDLGPKKLCTNNGPNSFVLQEITVLPTIQLLVRGGGGVLGREGGRGGVGGGWRKALGVGSVSLWRRLLASCP